MKTNTFNKDHVECKAKKVARKLGIEAIKASYIPHSCKRFLGLPYEQWTFEKTLLGAIGTFNLFGVEYNETTFIKMKKFAANHTNKSLQAASCHNGALQEMIEGKPEGFYSHINADYTGQLPTYEKELRYALENKIVEVDGVIIITTNERLSPTKNDKGNKLANMLIKKHGKVNGVTRYENMLRNFIIDAGKDNFEIVEKPYKYRNNGSNMIQIIARRVK